MIFASSPPIILYPQGLLNNQRQKKKARSHFRPRAYIRLGLADVHIYHASIFESDWDVFILQQPLSVLVQALVAKRDRLVRIQAEDFAR